VAGAQLERLQAHAREGYPHEVCGILAGSRDRNQVTEVVPLLNERADSPRNRYRVSGLAMMKAEQAIEERGLEVVGYYHSHPDHPSHYSDYDRDHALPNMSYPIVSIQEGRVADLASWRLTEDRSRMDPEPIEIT
jgi:proteasome lid subunit RPN8/RPN11